jgi:hypothetical protein
MGKRRLKQAYWAAAVLSRALLLASLFRATGVEAQEPAAERYRLSWTREGGAESCASGAALSRLLEQVLGAYSTPGGSAPVLLEGAAKVAPAPLRFAVRVSVRDAQSNEIIGERELTTADEQCSTLTPALLLVLAMSVDPSAGREGLPANVAEELKRTRDEDVDVWPATSTPKPSADQPAHATAAPAPRTVEMREAREQPQGTGSPAAPESREPLQIFAAFAASTGVLPALAPGAGLGLGVPLRRGFSLSLALFGWNAQTVELPSSPFLENDGVDVAASQLSGSLCRGVVGTGPRLALCAGFGLGLRWVHAQALSNESNPTRAFFGPELALQGSWQLGSSWVVGAGAAAQAQLRRDRFTYQPHDGSPRTWFHPDWLASRFWLSVGALP